MPSFWTTLPRPFFALAPMEDVTDAAFRALIARYGKPHVFYTEFISADGLVFAQDGGRRRLESKLSFTPAERPIVAQLFTASPERMEQAARLVAEHGFDGVDINMGCPDRAVEKQGSGAALIKNAPLARELIRAAKRGAPGMPVSVKTRAGYSRDDLDTWLPELLAEEPAAVTIHARTRAELSDVPAVWDRVARAVRIRDTLDSSALIMGNGDVRDLADAREKAAATGADGVMLGRAVFGNPWLFSDATAQSSSSASLRGPSSARATEGAARLPPEASREGGRLTAEAPERLLASHPNYVHTPAERIAALIEHIHLFQEKLSGLVSEAVMKRHFKAYINGWPGAAELRAQLMETHALDDAVRILENHA